MSLSLPARGCPRTGLEADLSRCWLLPSPVSAGLSFSEVVLEAGGGGWSLTEDVEVVVEASPSDLGLSCISARGFRCGLAGSVAVLLGALGLRVGDAALLPDSGVASVAA